IPVVGEFPVRSLFRLRIADLAEQDQVISGIAALAIRGLLAPIRERIGLGLIGLVDQQENAAVRGIPDIHVVAVMRDPPAARDADRETGRVGETVVPGRERARSAARRGAAGRGTAGRGRGGRWRAMAMPAATTEIAATAASTMARALRLRDPARRPWPPAWTAVVASAAPAGGACGAVSAGGTGGAGSG